MHKTLNFFFISLIFLSISFGQEKGKSQSLYESFSKGDLDGEVRNFFMNTINRNELKDYYTNATGIALMYETKPLKGFSVGVNFRSVFRTFGNHLSGEDSQVSEAAKWEYELYDLLDKGNYKDINKVEELYLKYRFNSSYVSFGRLETEYTPLLNNSDGRMGPFAHQGLWLHHAWGSGSSIDFGYINSVSPRSTTDWFSLNQAIGLFTNGFLPNGEAADYKNKTNADGLGLFKYSLSESNLNVKVYDLYIHNLLNTLWIETDYTLKDWKLGLQYAIQHGVEAQRSIPLENQYIRNGENGQIFSSELSWSQGNWILSLAYSHLFDTGRFLFPKELGRDRFYTSISRSRMEGLGNANATLFKAAKLFPRSGFNLLLELQSITGVDLNEFTFNKYNKDESFQVNTIITYDGSQLLKGLSFETLLVYRNNQNSTSNEMIYNRSNFFQLNFMTYYKF